MQALMSIVFVLGLITYGIFQLAAGYVGIDWWLGGGWAIGVVLVALIFRFTLPVTIGAFLGAWKVWGWHWAFALAFAAPGLLAALPGMLMTVLAPIALIASSRKGKHAQTDVVSAADCQSPQNKETIDISNNERWPNGKK